jgi:DNA sulfur modification protein DndD
MIIKSLTLKNFKSYRGENTIKFSKGLNIISGSIGSGKTSLYESFQWLIEDRDDQYTEEKFVPNLGILSENIKSGSNFEVSVELHFENKGKDCSVTKAFEYEIVNNTHSVINKFFKYTYINEITGETISETDEYNVKRTISKEIFPQQIREYLLFKGENLDNLIDFQNPRTLKSAVDRISYLKYYESISNNTSTLLSKLQTKLSKKIRVSESNKAAISRLDGEIHTIKEFKLPKLDEKINNTTRERDSLITRSNKLLDSIKNHGDYPQYKTNYENSKEKISETLKEISRFDLNFKKTYLSELMIFGQENVLKNCEKEFKKYNDEKNKKREEANDILDVGIPGDELTRQMLKDCKCVICGHEFEKNSEEYKQVESHLDSKKLNIKSLISDEEIQFQRLIDDFKSSIPVLKKKVHNSKDYFDSVVERKQKLSQTQTYWIDEQMSYRDKIGELLKKNPSLNDSRDSGEINAEYKSVLSTLERKRELISSLEKDKINTNIRLKKLNAEKNKYAENPEELETSPEQQAMNYIYFLNKLSEKQIEKEKVNFVKNIELKSNSIQEGIMKSGTAKNLVVLYSKIDPDDLSIDFHDIDGNPNPGHGAQLTLSKLSIISSVLKLSNEKVNEVFPFIVDAPTSEFDDNIYEPYLKSLSSNLVQSIVMLKDIDNKIDSYKNKDFVDCLYKIEKKLTNNEEAGMGNSYTVNSKIK